MEPQIHKKETSENVKDAVLKRLEADAVAPRPKLHFLLKNYVFWSLWGVTLLMGAFASAAIIFQATHAGWEMYEVTHDNFITFLMNVLPFVWVVLLIAMVGLGYYNMRHTKCGYRYSLLAVIGVSVATSIVGGAVLHAAGVGRAVDEQIGRYVPFHKPVSIIQREIWSHPERGLVAGEVKHIASTTVTLKSLGGDEVVMNTRELAPRDREILRSEKGMVRVIGVPSSSSTTFYACAVLPWNLGKERTLKDIRQLRAEFQERDEYYRKDLTREQQITHRCKGLRPDVRIREGAKPKVLRVFEAQFEGVR